MVTVDFGLAVATIDDLEWTCEDAGFLSLLTAMLNPLGPSGADPDPDYTAAMAAIEQLGGTITQRDEVEYVEGRVY